MAGYFNAKLGLRQHTGEQFMRAREKGTRNKSGENLAHFFSEAELYATSTKFQKAMRHRTTWQAHIQRKKRYNQIDYVVGTLDLSAMYRKKKVISKVQDKGQARTFNYNTTVLVRN